jgi:hypothetical protein
VPRRREFRRKPRKLNDLSKMGVQVGSWLIAKNAGSKASSANVDLRLTCRARPTAGSRSSARLGVRRTESGTSYSSGNLYSRTPSQTTIAARSASRQPRRWRTFTAVRRGGSRWIGIAGWLERTDPQRHRRGRLLQWSNAICPGCAPD